MQIRLSGLVLVALAVACNPAPERGPSTESQPNIRLLAYNIHHGEGMDEVTDLQRIADMINDLNPDLVTLQEVDSVADRTGQTDQAAVLAELTDMSYAYGRFMPYQGGAYGMAVLSRWPIEERINVRLTDGEEPRTALAVRVREPASEQELLLVGIHFYRTEEERLAQAVDLVTFLDQEAVPVILAGDFNSEPESPVMELLREQWAVLDKGDDRYTFSSFAPEKEIDFVLIRPQNRFEVLEHRPLDETIISDHRPIWTELRLLSR